MTTPALSAALASPAKDAGAHAASSAKSADDGAGSGFDAILAGRPTAQPPAGTSAGGTSSAKTTGTTGKKDDTKHTDDADASAVAPGAEPSLPQLALYIAAQANPTATAPAGSGTPATDTSARQPITVDTGPDAAKTKVTAMLADQIRIAADAHAATNPAQAATTGQADTGTADTDAAKAKADPAASFMAALPPAVTENLAKAMAAQNDKRGQPVQTERGGAKPGAATPANHSLGIQEADMNDNDKSPATHAQASVKTGAPALTPAQLAMLQSVNRIHASGGDASNPAHADSAMLSMAASLSALTSSAGGQPATVTQSAQAAIPVPLQSPQWTGEFGRQFINLTQSIQGGGSHTAKLRLDPPNLGPLQISININDNVAHAIFVSPHAVVRQAVQNALPQLQQQLAQAGISLGQTSVSDQGSSREAFGDSPSSGQRRSSGQSVAGIGAAASASTPAPVRRSQTPDALVDTFV